MDPLRARLLPADPRRRRIAIAVLGLVALVVLGVGVAVSLRTNGGSTTELPRIRTAPTATAAATPLLVQVVGAVRRPGVVAVGAGARVLDAVAAAGGATPEADLASVPMAAMVADGQRVDVPGRGATPTAASGAATSGAAPASAESPISLSTATAAQLETLPRVGPAMAARILAWRAAHGGFRTVADLQQVSGIGPKTYEALKGLVTP